MSMFAGYRAVIVGGSAGIGRATALMLEGRGAQVFIIDRNDAAPFACARADLADASAVEAAMESAARALGGIDILVNSAGIDLETPSEAGNDDDWSHLLSVNLSGPMRTARAAFPYLAASGHGAIVNVSSGAGLKPIPDRAAYCASKAGLVMLSKSLALDWAEEGIRVNTVCPGAVHSDLFDQSWANAPDPQTKLSEIRDRYALRRIAQPEELAEAIVFLAGPAACHITGSTLAVDGGRTFY
ncbi:SDR family NAD(P)-dependent oxidoreductase [Thioclava kandeliae]|uniref:SDR family oxidoreductase n=1 Tax=Thioclava kandeliae TaxID=3070818 RepID=A0ABV1SJN9_9RHOB